MAQPALVFLSGEDLDQLTLEQLWNLPLGETAMALTLQQVKDHFKQLGKFIFADRWGREQMVALQKIVVGAVNQVRAADPDYYNDVVAAVMPFQSAMDKSVQQAVATRDIAKAACTNLLTKAIAVDLGLPAGAALATVGDAFIALMNDVGATVAPKGLNNENANGFAVYFSTALGIELPSSETPAIPDSYIDDDLT